MIGPSAPNGPPVPMAIAADSGLATAVRGAIRLWRVSTASIASGMPWPRITGAHRASSVTTAAPSTAATTISGDGWRSREGRQRPAPLVEQDHVGDQADEVHQHPRRAAAGDAEDGGEHGEAEVGDARRRASGHDMNYRGTI